MSLARAIETGDLSELPSRRDEAWHWTDLRGLIRELPPRSAAASLARGDGPFDALGDEVVSVVNGQLAAPSIVCGPGRRVLALRLIGEGDGSHVARPTIEVEPGGHLVLLESYEGREGGYLSEVDLTVEIAPGARLDRVVLAEQGPDVVSVARADVRLGVGANFTQTVVASGARRQRLETRLSHAGGGAAARLDGIYLLAGRVHADITTVVTHDAADGTTQQLTKGVVRDQARGVFQGRIVVSEGADRTDAKMGHHALVLSDRAEVDAKPELEIYADDVLCAHGNTVGALDEEALFYAAQRGIPPAEARAMLIEAFVGEVVDRIGHDGARAVVRAWVAERLRPAP